MLFSAGLGTALERWYIIFWTHNTMYKTTQCKWACMYAPHCTFTSRWPSRLLIMAIRLFYKMESEKEKNGTQADSCLAKTFCERVLKNNISHVLKDRQWVKWMGGWRGGYHGVCLWGEKMRACRVNEERNEIGREGAMPQTESWG